MKKIVVGRTINDARKILKNFDSISIRLGYKNKYIKYHGFGLMPEYFKMLIVLNVFSVFKNNEKHIFLTV